MLVQTPLLFSFQVTVKILSTGQNVDFFINDGPKLSCPLAIYQNTGILINDRSEPSCPLVYDKALVEKPNFSNALDFATVFVYIISNQEGVMGRITFYLPLMCSSVHCAIVIYFESIQFLNSMTTLLIFVQYKDDKSILNLLIFCSSLRTDIMEHFHVF